MEINDLIFKELLKRGYKLEGKTRVWDVADSKLWYLIPKQAQGFLDLSKTEGYKKTIIDKEVSLIKQNMKDFVHALPKTSCNIIDLGCGDGQKASLFIHELAKHMKIRYCPIDISSYMVSKAAKTIRKMKVGEVLEFRWNISYFENLNNITPLFRETGFETHFMMLLGNTLGNFDREDILHGIRTSMNKDDILLIGNGLTNGNANWTEKYKDTIINNWLVQIPQQLGLTKKDIAYDVRFVNSRIEELYILNNDKTIKHLGRTLNFKKGDVIITAISYKYTKPEFKKILEKFFSSVKIYSDSRDTYGLALCKR
ncbi:L-histidine N(alpha)-methyltransferase [Candidatus Woesearchaeota archaeon]|nr:L-histidine N(alpha)-methyltransferase [Candidatus Woesearchaeota archaeon]